MPTSMTPTCLRGLIDSGTGAARAADDRSFGRNRMDHRGGNPLSIRGIVCTIARDCRGAGGETVRNGE
jgi:hypothetical protein